MGGKTEAKRNIQSRNQPDLLQAILTQHPWQAKGGIFPQSSPPYALLLPDPHPPEWSCCPPTALFSSFSPNFCRILAGKRQESTGLGLGVLFAPVARPRRVPFPPPRDLHPRECPMLSNSITSHLHSCLPTARAPGWVPAAGQPPSSPSCALKRAAGVHQLPTGSFSSEGCVNESLDIAEALVLGRAQRRLEQSQQFQVLQRSARHFRT